MATTKVFSLGGMDLRSNDLIRPSDKASDMLNMEYNNSSTLKKRTGFSAVTIDGVSLATFLGTSILKDVIYYSVKDQMVLFYVDAGLTSVVVTALERVGTTLNWTSKVLESLSYTSSMFPISSCESQQSLYFTVQNSKDSVFSNQRTFKYDGSFLTYSGLFAPYNTYTTTGGVKTILLNDATNGLFIATPTTTATSLYTRIFAKYIDYNGVVTYGPYVQSPTRYEGGGACKVSNYSNLNSYTKYLAYSKVGTFTFDSSNRTILSSSHNYVAGDKFILINDSADYAITTPADSTFLQLTVESVVANTSVTFTATSIGIASVNFTSGHYLIDRRCRYKLAVSYTPDDNYYVVNVDFISNLLNTSDTFDISGTVINPNTMERLESFYSSTTQKLCPPLCRYIASSGEQILYGNVYSVFDGNNQPSLLSISDSVYFSDTDLGDGPEGTSGYSYALVSETGSGVITGVARCNDSVVVFKERGVFTLDGTLLLGQFLVRKISVNSIGCTTFKSILDTDEGLYFQGYDGLYFTNGVGVKKVTEELDSVFPPAAYLNTRSVRLKKRKKSLFYIADFSAPKIVVMDYDYNQVYFWDSITASIGFIEDKNGTVYFSNGTGLFALSEGTTGADYLDNGAAISCYYKTTWHHAGEPSLNKKWLSLRTFGLTSDDFTATITTEGDWIEGTTLTTSSQVYASTTQTAFTMLNMQTKRSLRIKFANAEASKCMVITGYELTWEPYNVVDKN